MPDIPEWRPLDGSALVDELRLEFIEGVDLADDGAALILTRDDGVRLRIRIVADDAAVLGFDYAGPAGELGVDQ